MRLVVALMLVSLSACSRLPFSALLPASAYPAEVLGVRIHYARVPTQEVHPSGAHYGTATWYQGACLVKISDDSRIEAKYIYYLVAHEVGHCLDHGLMNYNHGGYSTEGCRVSAYFCKPAEYFADRYAHLYLERCGQTLEPLGFRRDGGICTPPDPREAALLRAAPAHTLRIRPVTSADSERQ